MYKFSESHPQLEENCYQLPSGSPWSFSPDYVKPFECGITSSSVLDDAEAIGRRWAESAKGAPKAYLNMVKDLQYVIAPETSFMFDYDIMSGKAFDAYFDAVCGTSTSLVDVGGEYPTPYQLPIATAVHIPVSAKEIDCIPSSTPVKACVILEEVTDTAQSQSGGVVLASIVPPSVDQGLVLSRVSRKIAETIPSSSLMGDPSANILVLGSGHRAMSRALAQFFPAASICDVDCKPIYRGEHVVHDVLREPFVEFRRAGTKWEAVSINCDHTPYTCRSPECFSCVRRESLFNLIVSDVCVDRVKPLTAREWAQANQAVVAAGLYSSLTRLSFDGTVVYKVPQGSDWLLLSYAFALRSCFCAVKIVKPRHSAGANMELFISLIGFKGWDFCGSTMRDALSSLLSVASGNPTTRPCPPNKSFSGMPKEARLFFQSLGKYWISSMRFNIKALRYYMLIPRYRIPKVDLSRFPVTSVVPLACTTRWVKGVSLYPRLRTRLSCVAMLVFHNHEVHYRDLVAAYTLDWQESLIPASVSIGRVFRARCHDVRTATDVPVLVFPKWVVESTTIVYYPLQSHSGMCYSNKFFTTEVELNDRLLAPLSWLPSKRQKCVASYITLNPGLIN